MDSNEPSKYEDVFMMISDFLPQVESKQALAVPTVAKV